MAEMKTKPTAQSVEAFLNGIADEEQRRDCFTLLSLMREASGFEPQMWGTSMIGFGRYHYRYRSGQEGDWFLIGFSPRKQNLSLHIMCGVERHPDLLAKLGKHSTGRSCLHIKRLADIDLETLRTLISDSVSMMKTDYL